MIPDLFKNCDVQYAYNQRQKIYSVKVLLDNRPRIITLRVGDSFTELSLADKNGKGITLNKND
jgi:hypothetical protein